MEAFERAKNGNGRLHFLGLVRGDPFSIKPLLISSEPCPSPPSPPPPISLQVSDGGVHSHISHLEALLEAAKEANIPHCFVQFFADGRDTSPTSGGTMCGRLLL